MPETPDLTRKLVYELINRARILADKQHGNIASLARTNPDRVNTILVEEVGEVANALLEGGRNELVSELLDVAQVVVAWLEVLV